MGFWELIGKLKWPEMPPAKDIANIPKQIKEASMKGEANKIHVKYFSSTGPFSSDGIGTIVRDTKIPICYVNLPEPMGFLMRPNSERYNLTTKRREIFLLEGYSAALVMGEAFDEYLQAEENARKAGLLGHTGELLMPVTPEDIPQIDCSVEVDGEEIVVMPKTLSQMGTSQWMTGISAQPVSGVAVIFIMGFALGNAFFAIVSAIGRGG